MGKVRTLGYALGLFISLVFFAFAALAQTCMPTRQCTPVVFAFRHAEDTKGTPIPTPTPKGAPTPPFFSLSPSGMRHAVVYATIVPAFTDVNHFCPVTKVYSTTTARKSDNSANATNAFFTGKPLANQVMGGKDPITAVTDAGVEYQLDEYLGNGINFPTTPAYNKSVAKGLRAELLKTANCGESSAIFWTSQGLHVLGGAIINAKSNVPDKNKVDTAQAGTPPRNAAYVFKAMGTAPGIEGFSDIPLRANETDPVKRAAFYVQCFNHIEYTQSGGVASAKFTESNYCGFYGQSNLGGDPKEPCNLFSDPHATCGSSIPNDVESTPEIKTNKDVVGEICDTTNLSHDQTADTFGSCN